MSKIRLAVLIGSGSRLPFIYEYCTTPDSPYELVLVVSYKKETPTIAWAKSKGINALYHRWVEYKKENKTREQYNSDLTSILQANNVDLVLGCGWNIIWTPNFLNAYAGRILNAHPFPLPDEPVETVTYKDTVLPVLRGTDTLKRAWEMNLSYTGACVHMATEIIDVGKVIHRDYMKIKKNETFESLEMRHTIFEGRVLVKALDTFSKEYKKNYSTKSVNKKKSVLVIGSGGREHALIWKIKQSSTVDTVYCAPGNGGIAQLAEIVPIDVTNIEALVTFAKENHIALTVVGPEASLAVGIVDRFIQEGLRIFGPTKEAARLETSKAWATDFMQRHHIPHPKSMIFDHYEDAYIYAHQVQGNCVIKVDGLASGKGVFVCANTDDAWNALVAIFKDKQFGTAGKKVVIQQKLKGTEVSFMAFCDGKVAIPLISAQDHKRIFDNDEGPNTGGMGAYAPSPTVTPILYKKMHRILTLAVEAMREEGNAFTGILYGGFMVLGEDPYVLEFNTRFGDPETQAQLPLLKSDLIPILEACIDGTLSIDLIEWYEKYCACVMLTSKGYPNSYSTGIPIGGLPLKNEDILLFHSGTKKVNSHYETAGGRVIGIASLGESLPLALERIYSVIGTPINFDGMHYRKDIGING